MKRIFSFIVASVLCLSSGLTVNADTDSREIRVSTTEELLDALANAQAGDEIIVAEGVYTNDKYVGAWAAFYSAAEGTAKKPIILRSEAPDKHAVLCGVDQSNKIAIYITGDHWIIKDIDAAQAQKGIVLDNSCYSVISGCEVYNTGLEGIHIRNDSCYCLIENCNIHDTGSVKPGYGEGIYIGSARGNEDYGFDCHYNTIRGCKIGPNVAAEHIDIKEFTIGTVVENCIFDGAGMSGENYADSFIDIKGNDVIVRGNTGYRNGNDIITDAFQLYSADKIWGQNSLIYGNTVYMDGPECNVVSGEDCSAKISNNKRIPEGNIFRGSGITDIITGDTNEDNALDKTDITGLSSFLLGKSGQDISLIASDIIPDGVVDIFDLCALRKQLMKTESGQCGFYELQPGSWTLYNGAGGKKLRFTFSGKPGYRATIGGGYWDSSLTDEKTGKTGVWVNNDSTNFGSNTFDENGEAVIEWELPEKASNVKISIYYYAYYDPETKTNTVYDNGEVVLKSVTY